MCFLLADHNGRSEMNVDDDYQLLFAWLEEEMFDVAVEDVYSPS